MTEIELLRAENTKLRKIAADLSLIVGEIIAAMPLEWQELENVRCAKHINDKIIADLVKIDSPVRDDLLPLETLALEDPRAIVHASNKPIPAGEQDTGEWA